MHAGKLVEKLAGRADSALPRLEHGVDILTDAEFNAVVALELVALDPLSIDIGAVAAANVHRKHARLRSRGRDRLCALR